MKISTAMMDRIEQAAALALYASLAVRVWPENFSLANLGPALVLVSEGVIILFLIIRRPTADISMRFQDWLAAAIGTAAPLLVAKTEEPWLLAPGAAALVFGMMIQISAKLSLRRSFGLVAANRGVKTRGAYRFVRHPMYLGYMVSHAGFLMMAPSLRNLIVYALAWTCLVLRVEFEERLLSSDAGYQAFKGAVRYRLVPGLF